ncbi:MAG: hypothetical protein WDZ70_02545 [Candidatus Paceibacterota bacterium]
MSDSLIRRLTPLNKQGGTASFIANVIEDDELLSKEEVFLIKRKGRWVPALVKKDMRGLPQLSLTIGIPIPDHEHIEGVKLAQVCSDGINALPLSK